LKREKVITQTKYNIGILATHPIQYYVPWYRALAKYPEIDLKVFYCHRQSPKDQAKAGFDVAFDWDISLLEGYEHRFLENKSCNPNVYTFFGCNTPEIEQIIAEGSFHAFIVHGWNTKSFWQAITACRKKGVPIIARGDSYLFTNVSFLKRLLKYPIYRWFIPRFSGYMAAGTHSKEYYLHYGADKNKIFVVPHAVDNDFFAKRAASFFNERMVLRKTWNIPENAFVFLFAGKLIRKKKPLDFIKAIGIARRDSPNIFGLVVGDGPLRKTLENIVKKKNIPVTFTGFLNQTEIPKAYAVSDMLVLPSGVGETWGLVVNEAFACGLPAIVSDKVGCAPDLVHSGKTGETYRCADIKRLSTIIKTLALNRKRLKDMAKKANNLITNYSIAVSAKSTLKAIKSVLDNKGMKSG